MCLFRITKTGINPLESIKAEPAVMLPVGDKKIHNPVSLRVVYVIYREKEIVCAASANMDMLITLCALAYPLLCIFLFLQFFWNDWHRTILCADIRADIDTYAVSLGDRFPGEDRSNERPCERVTCSYGISNLYLRCLKI